MEEQKIKKISIFFKNQLGLKISATLLFVFFIFIPKVANAASIYFQPSTGSYTINNIFTVNAYIDTKGEAINNAEGIINFPTEYLSVVSLNQSGSAFSLWVQPPSFSNNNGTISFNGGLPTPGYNGSSGKLFGIVFKAEKAGVASLVFSSAAVRANDGLGTDILKTRGEASFNLIAPTEKKVPPLSPFYGNYGCSCRTQSFIRNAPRFTQMVFK